jgi:hypothetical protein
MILGIERRRETRYSEYMKRHVEQPPATEVEEEVSIMAQAVRFLLRYHDKHLSASLPKSDDDILRANREGEGQDHRLRKKGRWVGLARGYRANIE